MKKSNKAIISGRSYGKSVTASLNDLFKQAYGFGLDKATMTVEDWCGQSPITEEDLQLYENARLSQTRLVQALSEVTEEEKRDLTKSTIADLIPDGVKLANMIKPFPDKGNLYNQPVVLVNPKTYDALTKETKNGKK